MYHKEERTPITIVKEAVKRFKKVIIGGVATITASGLLLLSMTFIPANHVGVVFNPFGGGVQDSVAHNGVYFKKPFVDKIHLITLETQSVEVANMTSQSRDGQWLAFELDVKYSIKEDNAMTVFQQFKTVSNVSDNLIKPTVQRAVEKVTVNFDVVELLGLRRNEMYDDLESSVREELLKFGISLESITIKDSDAGDEIENAIKAEAVAQKEVDTAKQHQAKLEIENETAIMKQEAEAEKRRIQAEAEANANKVINDSLTPELIEYKEAEARMQHGWIQVITQEAIVDTGK